MSKKFLSHKCQICGTNTSNYKFCSNKCVGEYNKIRTRPNISPNTGRIGVAREERSCLVCKKTMVVRQTSTRIYCSKQCASVGIGRKNKGRPAWNKGVKAWNAVERILVKCSDNDCSNMIPLRPLEVKRLKEQNRKHFCSEICYSNWKSITYSGSGNPMSGIKRPNFGTILQKVRSKIYTYGKRGFREDIGHYVRSSWEADFARLWKYLKAPYEYEKHRFDLDEFGKYTPDFYLPESNRYYEVKGRMDMEFIENRLKRLYEKYSIEINMVSRANFLWMLVYIRDNFPDLFETLENKHLVKHLNFDKIRVLQKKELMNVRAALN